MKFHSIGIVEILGACLLMKLVTIIIYLFIYFNFKGSSKNCECTTKVLSCFEPQLKIESSACFQSQ
jgi:hypothetical protein